MTKALIDLGLVGHSKVRATLDAMQNGQRENGGWICRHVGQRAPYCILSGTPWVFVCLVKAGRIRRRSLTTTRVLFDIDAEVLKRMVEIVRKNPIACLATTDGATPRARYITIRHVDDDLTLTCATGMTDMKTVHIKKNPNVHIITGFPPAGEGMPNLSIEARATIHTDQPIRERYWEESFLEHFSGPDHEHYIILKLHPKRAWMSTGEEVADFQLPRSS